MSANSLRTLGALCAAALCVAAIRPHSGVLQPGLRIAVLDFEFNNVSQVPDPPEGLERTARAGPRLREILAERCHYDLVSVDPEAQRRANNSLGYLVSHPADAALLGKRYGADWVVVGQLVWTGWRLTDLHVVLVNVSGGTVGSPLAFELKGDPGDSVIFAKGIAHVARQVDREVAEILGDPVGARRCPADL